MLQYEDVKVVFSYGSPCVNKKDYLILLGSEFSAHPKTKNQEYIIKKKHPLLSLVAILFPCAILFSDDNPLGGFVALVMQATLIGWIPAVMWAWKIVHRDTEAPSVAETPPLRKSRGPASGKTTK